MAYVVIKKLYNAFCKDFHLTHLKVSILLGIFDNEVLDIPQKALWHHNMK